MLVVVIMIALAVAGWLIARASNDNSYGSNLEDYINANRPQHSGDVERLTVEFNLKQHKKQYHL